jgi:hypothetical protein
MNFIRGSYKCAFKNKKYLFLNAQLGITPTYKIHDYYKVTFQITNCLIMEKMYKINKSNILDS